MNIALFYQLRERLCAAAVAGCDVISEDFRLKRAVEDFEPLAKANKVFGRLHAMCGELFTSDKPAPLLADCIALCDALAVTQGTFGDNSETSEFVGVKSCVPADVRYSSLSQNQEINEKRDPRVINFYLNKLKSDTYGNIKKFIVNLFGRDLVPMLKDRLDLTNPKEKGYLVEIVGLIAGADENEWYISLIYNEDISDSVRAMAVRNLMYKESNAERLLEIFRTEKAKLKDAAAYALVSLDVPEAEFVLKKITTGKFAKKNAELISISHNKIAVDFAVEYARKAFEEFSKTASKRTYDYDLALDMLVNKTESEEVLAFLANQDGKCIRMYYVNNILIGNLGGNKDEKFRVMIENLHKRSPEYFEPAYFILNAVENRGVRITDYPETFYRHHDYFTHAFLPVHYDSTENSYIYCINMNMGKNNLRIDDGKIDDILAVCSDTSYLDKKKKLFASNKEQEKEYFENRGYSDNACRLLKVLFNSVCETDKNRFCRIMTDFCKKVMGKSPTASALELLTEYEPQYIRENPHLIEDTVMYNLNHSLLSVYVFEKLPDDVIETAVIPVYRKLKTLKDKKYLNGNVSSQIRCIEYYLNEKGYDIAKIEF